MRAKVVYTDAETGNLVLVHPAYGDSVTSKRYPTEAALLQRAIDKVVPAGVTYHIVEQEDWPTDHTFVDAWEWSD